jgi:hypothetical protein
VTTSELTKFKEVYGKSITTNNLHNSYLEELMNNGYVDEENSQLDGRAIIYYPIIDIPGEEKTKIENYNNLTSLTNFFQCSRIRPPEDFKKIEQDWLKVQILHFKNG